MRIVSLQVGQPTDYPANPVSGAKAWSSAIDKRPVEPPVITRELGLDGDSVFNTEAHGGVDKSVLFYCRDHYADWAKEHPEVSWWDGAFGENVSVTDADEADVCIGDRWQAGDVVFEVSQPRQPCWKLARLHGIAALVKKSAKSGRTGWYVRVLQPGELGHCPMKLLKRPQPEWTVARCNQLLFNRDGDLSDIRRLFAVPELAADWKEALGVPG